MIKILLYLWQLPQHLLALIIMLLTKPKKQYGVYFVEQFFNSGVSLGNYTFLDTVWLSYPQNVWEETIKHEKGHAIQSKYLGVFYLLVVGLPSILGNIYARIFNKDSYWYYTRFPENWADKLGKVKRRYYDEY